MSHYLGQFTDDNADRIVEEFDEQNIEWSAKSSGSFVRFVFAADWGVRLFVADAGDASRAWAIATRIAPDGVTGRQPQP